MTIKVISLLALLLILPISCFASLYVPITLKWEGTLTAVQYTVYEAIFPNSTIRSVVMTPLSAGNKTSYSLALLRNGSLYRFCVTATDSAGHESDSSNLVEIQL